MNHNIHRISAWTGFVAVLFYLFFQVNKSGPTGAVNPFGVDPYDAIGSFAVQGALLVSLLTYARTLRLREDPTQADKIRFIQRGNGLALLAIGITLAADWAAVALQPYSVSGWEIVLLFELAALYAIALISVAAWAAVFRPIQAGAPRRDLTPADAMDDLWALARAAVRSAGPFAPRLLGEWVMRFNSDRLFARLPWIDPRRHPWRFASTVGLLAGILLVLAQLQEGPPPSLAAGLLVAGIFLGGELCATLLGFAIFGGFLGLRPIYSFFSSIR
jgi:hypothetical protein